MPLSFAQEKDPDEVLDYSVKWGNRLNGDVIVSSYWDVPQGLTQGPIPPSKTENECIIWLQGGTDGQSYEILNRITTAGGRTMDQTAKLKVKRR